MMIQNKDLGAYYSVISIVVLQGTVLLNTETLE